MTIQEVITKAIEGGWNYKHAYFYCSLENECTDHAFNDPLFWQALGKKLGWRNSDQTYVQPPDTNWRIHWHRLIDHLASNRTIESFFRDLT